MNKSDRSFRVRNTQARAIAPPPAWQHRCLVRICRLHLDVLTRWQFWVHTGYRKAPTVLAQIRPAILRVAAAAGTAIDCLAAHPVPGILLVKPIGPSLKAGATAAFAPFHRIVIATIPAITSLLTA